MGILNYIFPWKRKNPDEMFEREQDLPVDVTGNLLPEPDLDFMMIERSGQLLELYEKVIRLSEDRKARYDEYEEMEKEVILGSGLEMIVDDAGQFEMGRQSTVWPAASSQFAKEIQDFFLEIDLENRLWGWLYNTAKFGDFFLKIEGAFGVGITDVDEHTDPRSVYRVELGGDLMGFIEDIEEAQGAVGAAAVTEEVVRQGFLQPFDMVHFINNFKPSFETIKIKITEPEVDENGLETGLMSEKVRKVTSRYGTSVYSNARRAAKQLRIVEDSLVLARLSRSTLQRYYYINTEGTTPKERRLMMKEFERKLKRKTSIDIANNLYNSEHNPLSYNDEIFIPTSGGKGDVRVDQLGGDVDIKDIVDIDFYLNKVFSAIRIPKAFLGFEESLPGSLGSTTLTRLDIRYARMVKKIQRAVIRGLTRLVQIHLSYKFQISPNMEDIQLEMVPISGAEEDDRLDQIEKEISLASSLASLAADLEGQINTTALSDFIFRNILSLQGADISQILNRQGIMF